MFRMSSRPKPQQFVHIFSPSDVSSIRNQLLTDLFGGSLPSEVGTLASTTSPVAGLSGVSTTEELTMSAYSARPILWTPVSSNGDVIIMHQGHSWDYETGGYNSVLQAFITAGYAVCGLVMPGGANTTTSGSTVDHNGNEDSLDEFIGPVVIAVNTLANEGYSNIYGVGLSGGGWTITVAAAADSRIARSYPIAGSFPLYMPLDTSGQRDWEQEILQRGIRASYLDMYLLAACNGKQMQILYENDDCCFNRDQYDRNRPYAEYVAGAATNLGGVWELVWYEKTTHQWYTDVTTDILSDIAG